MNKQTVRGRRQPYLLCRRFKRICHMYRVRVSPTTLVFYLEEKSTLSATVLLHQIVRFALLSCLCTAMQVSIMKDGRLKSISVPISRI